MRQIGQFQFPEQGNVAEGEEWKPYIRVRALSSRVLVVAKSRIEGAWKAYCDSVPGLSHDREWQEVARSGCELPEELALAMFPEFQDVPYAR